MYVWESVHKQEVSFAETYFILVVCEDLRKLSDLRTGTCVLKRDVIKFFPVLLIEIGQEFFRASSFSLILFCLCLFCFFDHVTSYFGFSSDDFDRLLCARGKVCELEIYPCLREQANVSCQTLPKRICASYVTGRS